MTETRTGTQRFLKLASTVLETTTGATVPFELLYAVLDSLLDAALETVNAERAFVVAADSEDELTLIRMRNFEQPFSNPESRQIFAKTPIRLALAARETVVSHDAQQDSRFDESGSVEDLGLQVLAIQPLFVGARLIGALVVDSRREARAPYTKEALETLGKLAAQAGVVLDRLRAPILHVAAEEVKRSTNPRTKSDIFGSSSPMKKVRNVSTRLRHRHLEFTELLVGRCLAAVRWPLQRARAG
jgi:transcriptional regulator with GAF, ATPase, and Fis domain